METEVFSASAAVHAGVEEELAAAGLVDERANECPEDGEDPRGPDDEDPTQGFWIVGLADLDNVEESLDAWPPKVSHVQAICVEIERLELDYYCRKNP